MVKKVELHIDALIAIALVIVAAVAFIAYQRRCLRGDRMRIRRGSRAPTT